MSGIPSFVVLTPLQSIPVQPNHQKRIFMTVSSPLSMSRCFVLPLSSINSHPQIITNPPGTYSSSPSDYLPPSPLNSPGPHHAPPASDSHSSNYSPHADRRKDPSSNSPPPGHVRVAPTSPSRLPQQHNHSSLQYTAQAHPSAPIPTPPPRRTRPAPPPRSSPPRPFRGPLNPTHRHPCLYSHRNQRSRHRHRDPSLHTRRGRCAYCAIWRVGL